MPVMVEQIPLYRLTKAFYDAPSSTYVAEGEELEWDGIPNDYMEPLNQAAVEIKQAWVDKIDTYPKPFNVGNRTADISEMLVMAMQQRPRYDAPAMPQMDIIAAAAKLGVPAADLASALSAGGEPFAPPERGAGAFYGSGEVHTKPDRRIVTLAPAEPEEAPATARKMVRQENHLQVQEPKGKTRGRPRRVMSHADAQAPIAGSI